MSTLPIRIHSADDFCKQQVSPCLAQCNQWPVAVNRLVHVYSSRSVISPMCAKSSSPGLSVGTLCSALCTAALQLVHRHLPHSDGGLSKVAPLILSICPFVAHRVHVFIEG